jgi:membrane associated rhomboid family serine protease
VAREPIFNVPMVVVVSLALLVLVHVGASLLPPEDQAVFTLAMAFNPARFVGYAAQLPGGTTAEVTSFVTYQFIHGDLGHLTLNGAWLLAFGSAVAMRIGPVRFIVFTVLCGMVGAATFLVLEWGTAVSVIGASGAVSGLMAAALRFFFAALGRGGLDEFRNNPRGVPLLSLRAALTDRTVLTVIGVWLVINFGSAAMASSITSADGIAWQVHLGGFLSGLLLFGPFDRRATANDLDS